MSDRNGIFEGNDPFEISRRWLAEATTSEPSDANAATLATVGQDGLPNARIILVKAIEADAFVFFTNYQSVKGRELDGAGKAALNLHWKSLARQIRVRGTVERETPEASDAYYSSRPLGSRIGAWASRQSQKLDSKTDLMQAVAEAEGKYGGNPPRPPHWGGYRIVPSEIEFWAAGEFRLHDRFRWSRESPAAPWSICRLNP